ncbi:MAG: redoxin domain-containing protein [Acidobacteria bacterium]|nr:redoxin domain-containing protein [Acidobacteriota bacterium]
MKEFEARNIRVVAISVDPPATTKDHIRKQGFTYTFLSDEKLVALKKYDIVHAAGFEGADISRPAEFLMDPSGTIRWLNMTDNYNKRPKAQDVIKAFDDLKK